jgi:hypothetical protein
VFQGGASPIGFLTQHWLNEAFDNYVQSGKDLESGLKDAENYAKAFQECAANIPASDATGTQTEQDAMKAYLDCAVKVDPRLKDALTPLR